MSRCAACINQVKMRAREVLGAEAGIDEPFILIDAERNATNAMRV